MEKEFEDFFLYCHKITHSHQLEMKNILRPLKYHLWQQKLMKVLKLFFIFAAICCAIYYIDCLNWYFCAIGRITMIQSLPIWNWTYLANAKCLIPKAEISSKNSDILRTISDKDCRACEDYGN